MIAKTHQFSCENLNIKTTSTEMKTIHLSALCCVREIMDNPKQFEMSINVTFIKGGTDTVPTGRLSALLIKAFALDTNLFKPLRWSWTVISATALVITCNESSS
jgi:hypothetical protein